MKTTANFFYVVINRNGEKHLLNIKRQHQDDGVFTDCYTPVKSIENATLLSEGAVSENALRCVFPNATFTYAPLLSFLNDSAIESALLPKQTQ